MGQFKLQARGVAYGYGYNLRLSVMPSRTPVSSTENARRANTARLADAAQVNTFQAPASRSNPKLEEFYYVSTNRNEATAHFRHGQRASMVFGDGHVKKEKMEASSPDENLRGQFVGRLRV